MVNNIFFCHDADDDNTLGMNIDNTEDSGDEDIWAYDDDSDFDDVGSYTQTYDTDLDGVDDVAIEEIDLDGDGYGDIVTLVADTDGDGIFDTAIEEADLNFDGVADISYAEQDFNGDGVADTVVMQADYDFDGVADFAVVAEDTNFDGTADNFEMAVAADDGSGESYFMQAADLDFDGEIDDFHITRESDPFSTDIQPEDESDTQPEENDFEETSYYEDSDESSDGEPSSIHTPPDNHNVAPSNPEFSGEPEVPDEPDEPEYFDEPDEPEEPDNPEYIVNDDDDAVPFINLDDFDYDDDNDNGLHYTELENFDPADSDPEQVIGEPEDAMDLWEFQGDTNRCAIYSQKFVIEEYTGQEVDIEELVDVAEDNGWFTESGGTPIVYMDKLLDHYGVPNETSSGNDINDIIEGLDEGHKIIVAVDADEYWFGENDNLYTPGDGVNHAVEVIGFDNSDPENPVVILNDSGNPDGCGCEVPLETFVDAWEDGDCYMIECM